MSVDFQTKRSALRVIYAGTPEFAVPSLAALVQAGHEICMVLTQPDRPAGRGMKLSPSPVKQYALTQQLPVFQPSSLKADAEQAVLKDLQADIMVVAAYGLILPTAVLNMPKLGCINVHASLLPRWRGAAPIQRALLAGDHETGVTIMKVVPALDAGDMIAKVSLPITERDTAQSLHDAMAHSGADLLVKVMESLLRDGRVDGEAQDVAKVTYASKLLKTESGIHWHDPAMLISRQIRAFNPFPVANCLLAGQVCRLWMATASENTARDAAAALGEILALGDSITVQCGQGQLHIESLQLPGGKRLNAKQFLAGHPLTIGQRFDSATDATPQTSIATSASTPPELA